MYHDWITYGTVGWILQTLDRLGAPSKKHQEKCTIACFYDSHGSLTMPGSPIGPFVGSSWRRQTMLHVEKFNMSDRVALNGRSTGDDRTCDRNTHEQFLNRAQAHLAPKLPVFESRRMRDCSHKRASLMITHNDQTAYQTIHFKHNNNITWTRTVLGHNSNQM